VVVAVYRQRLDRFSQPLPARNDRARSHISAYKTDVCHFIAQPLDEKPELAFMARSSSRDISTTVRL